VQGEDPAKLPFKAWLYPWGTYFAVALNIFLVFFQGYTAFLNPFSADDFVINYILLPVFALFVLGYKFWHKTKWVKLEEMDIWTGRRESPDVDKADEPQVNLEKQKSWWSRILAVVIG
jgi:amino acid transporter